MPDAESLDIPLSGINPDLPLRLDSGKLTHCRPPAGVVGGVVSVYGGVRS